MSNVTGVRTIIAAATMGLALSAPMPASACGDDVRVTFIEASPDRFVIEYLQGTHRQLAAVTIDLTTSRGNAYVDTPYGPADTKPSDAVEFDTSTGFGFGRQTGTFAFRTFRPGGRFEFLVDLDDQAIAADGDTNILTAGELKGGKITVRFRYTDGTEATANGTFDETGIARIGNRACV